MGEKKGWFGRMRRHARHCVQIAFAALSNGYVNGFVTGRIFGGKSKAVCVPGLNCYSCPGALGACPIGSLQATLSSRNYQMAFYVIGFLMVVGALIGRFVCGFLCPFGLVQDLLYKIPFVKKMKNLPGDKVLRWLKYVVLILFVVLLPMFAVDLFGQGSPWFCAYICPSGTLMASVPLMVLNESLRVMAGWLYRWKMLLLILTVLLSVVVYRPFCKYLCPLGAIYGLFHPIAFLRIRFDAHKCVNCGVCTRTCKMGVDVVKTPNSAECIRCGECVQACPHGALSMGLREKKYEKAEDAK